MDWHKGGFTALIDNTSAPPTNVSIPSWISVFTELAALFPFPYVHVGGDECAKNFWEKSDAVKQLMQQQGLKTMESTKLFRKKGREGSWNPKERRSSAGMRSWKADWPQCCRHELARRVRGIAAAKLGHQVVMSPHLRFTWTICRATPP